MRLTARPGAKAAAHHCDWPSLLLMIAKLRGRAGEQPGHRRLALTISSVCLFEGTLGTCVGPHHSVTPHARPRRSELSE
jgi:hypothetical protein